MNTTAFLFPGQGAQKVGMGQALVQAYPVAAQTFQTADEILGYSLSKICFEGPAETLNETRYTQPALFVAGIAAWRALNSHFETPLTPLCTAGHSLGEITALVAAEAIDFEGGLKLVQKRADLMHAAGEKAHGGVVALLGLDIEAVRELCAEASQATGEIVVVANDNCPGQVVISGANVALEKAQELAHEKGAKRAVRLAVTVAVHSPLMQSAADEFAQSVDQTSIQTPKVPVIANVTAQPLQTAEAIQNELKQQITASVLWTGSVQTMLNLGATQFLEFGAGDVLIGLVKRISRDAKRVALETPEQIAAFVAE